MAGPALADVAALIASGSVKKVVVLTGAGVSVSAGIPDFRSPGGMYDTLRPELLTAEPADRVAMGADPTWVVNKMLFTRNQLPYLEVRRPFICGLAEGKWKATLSHAFVRVLHDKGLLTRLYTQNIDGLDFLVGLPKDKIVSVHGSMGVVKCERCGHLPDGGDLAAFAKTVTKNIRNIYDPEDADAPKTSTPIPCPACGKPQLKPNTVLYGASMPTDFIETSEKDLTDDQQDLMFVMGTSLRVQPAANLPDEMPDNSHRVLINNEPAGEFALASPGYHFLQGECDAVVADLCSKLGWLPDLLRLRDSLAENSVAVLDAAVAASEQ